MIPTEFEIDLQDPPRKVPQEVVKFCQWVQWNSAATIEVSVRVYVRGEVELMLGAEQNTIGYTAHYVFEINDDFTDDAPQAAWDEILKQIREAEPCPDV